MSLNKEILDQYCELTEEIKDIHKRKEKLEREIENLSTVTDTVKGTRRDGTYGSIKITGYPTLEYDRKKRAIERHRRLLDVKETELLELAAKAEEFIESVDRSEIRVMFRLYYMDGMPWWKVAMKMNDLFPNRRLKFTEDSCRIRITRFFEKK